MDAVALLQRVFDAVDGEHELAREHTGELLPNMGVVVARIGFSSGAM